MSSPKELADNSPTYQPETDRAAKLFYEGKRRVSDTGEMVEPRGFEPLTPTMPLWCSTN